METIAISAFKATCLAVLERVRKTRQPLLVTKRGVPIAQVNPPPPASHKDQSAFGCMADTAEEIEDIVEPLAPDDWDALR